MYESALGDSRIKKKDVVLVVPFRGLKAVVRLKRPQRELSG